MNAMLLKSLTALYLGIFFMMNLATASDYPNAISPAQAKSLLDKNAAVLIDVREESEVAEGMAAPALWYAKSAIDADLVEFEKFLSKHNGKEIILYCRSGRRSSVVLQMLAGKKISAKNMGSFSDWAAAGYPTKRYTK